MTRGYMKHGVLRMKMALWNRHGTVFHGNLKMIPVLRNVAMDIYGMEKSVQQSGLLLLQGIVTLVGFEVESSTVGD
jgi:hypothetical protein